MKNDQTPDPIAMPSGREPLRFLRRLVLAGVDLYGVSMALYLVLRFVFRHSSGAAVLISTVLHWLLLPSLVLLPLALWRRTRRAAGILAGCVAVFLILFGELFLPRLSTPDQSDLRVMTFNTGAILAPPELLVELVGSSGADIVALLELSAENATAIEREESLTELYPYQVLYGLGIHGKGLLSRCPILEEELFYLQPELLPHLRAVVATDGVGAALVEITVLVGHSPRPDFDGTGLHPNPGAAAEIEALARMTASAAPAILVGDLNIVDQADDYPVLVDAGLRDAFREAGWGFGSTWPLRVGPSRPAVRIDYVWYTEEFEAVRSWVGPDAGSDHLPVLAELMLQLPE